MKSLTASRRAGARVWTWPLVRSAAIQSFRKLDPRWLARNPVMFVVEIGSVLTTFWAFRDLFQGKSVGFDFQIAAWLWFTVLFANFAEAMAEARGKAQADTLRATKKDTPARRLRNGAEEMVSSSQLRRGDIVLVRDGEIIPGDGEVTEGVAYVNEAAITGESAPVLKEPGTDIRSGVTGGTQVVSDWLKIRITADPGETFLDRMIALVEGAQRQKTPNEIALTILLAGLSIIFLLVVVSLQPFAVYAGDAVSTIVLVALLVCLLPTTIGALLSAIGIAGMDRVTRFNVLAMSGRAVETSGDVDVLLLDKTGTITYGNRLAAEIVPVGQATREQAAKASLWSSLGDDTPEGKSIVALARQMGTAFPPGGIEGLQDGVEVIPFSAETRMSGLRRNGSSWMKGAVDAITASLDGETPPDVQEHADRISREGGTPLAVSENGRVVAVVYLKDTVKPGMRARFDELRRMGIRTLMITGDNPLTAATIARRRRRGRLRGGGEAGGQDPYHSRAPGRRPPGGHERRRHQRRARSGPGGRGPGDELRHGGGQGGRQHGGPGLQPHQDHRGRPHRQAAAHHSRRHHHLLRSPTMSPSTSPSSPPPSWSPTRSWTRSTSCSWPRRRAPSFRRSSSTPSSSSPSFPWPCGASPTAPPPPRSSWPATCWCTAPAASSCRSSGSRPST